MKSQNRFIIALSCLLLLFIFLSFGFYNGLEVTSYTYQDENLPEAFDGYKIVQISDLHSAVFGHKQEDIIHEITKLQPDLIFLTGDIIDSNPDSVKAAIDLIYGIYEIAPIYAVSGNHENDNLNYKNLLDQTYLKCNVTILDNKSTTLTLNSDTITITGYTDGYSLNGLPVADSNHFNILLYHYANHFDYVAAKNYNLVISGHAHGGIVRIPLIGGLIANDGTLFPKYDAGIYTSDSSTMILSRGLGDTDIPRFFNRPELVFITLVNE